jgi:flagellar hook-associated protein 1
MNIGNSLNTALAGLNAASAGIDLTSRNIANANEPGYTRKTQAQKTGIDGAPALESVQRVIDAGLQKTSRDAASSVGMLDAQSRYATQISLNFGAPGDATSLSTLTSELGDAFRSLSTNSQSDSAYTEVITAAQSVAAGIRGLYQQVQSVATNAGNELDDVITAANKDLTLIDSLNKKIIANTSSDTTDLEDQRDQAIADLSGKIDITTFTRPDGGVAVYTKSGAVLVDASASTLTSQQTASTGPVQLVVQLAQGSVSSTQVLPRSGAITGLMDVINTQVPNLQSQLDAFAGTLTTAFSAVGVELFNDGGGTTYDPVGTPAQAYGFGNRIAVNTAIVNAPQSIRDGNSGTTLALGDTTYIDAAGGIFQSNTHAFSGPGMAAQNSLAGAASDIITGQSNTQAALDGRLKAEQTTRTAIDTLISSDSGVNLDAEFSHLLQLQQAYAANARIISTTQSLFNTLLVASGGTAIS